MAVNLQTIGGGLVELSKTGQEDWDWNLAGEQTTTSIDLWTGVFEVPPSMSQEAAHSYSSWKITQVHQFLLNKLAVLTQASQKNRQVRS